MEVTEGGLVVDGQHIEVPCEPDVARLPWAELGVDVVIDSTGLNRSREAAAKHLEAGAEKVIISAPAKDPDVTVALGVNFDRAYDPEPTGSSRTPRARRTASLPWPRCCTKASASATA